MIRSMTGFGEAQLEQNSFVYHLEMRSVNNRYLKTVVHLPEDFAFLETDVERLLRGRLARGTVTARLFIRNLTAAAAQELNEAALRSYAAQLRRVCADETRFSIDLAMLATLPGVCQPRELTDRDREKYWEILERLTLQALDRLLEMRRVEGETLAADLRGYTRRMADFLRDIRARTPVVVEEYRQRLTHRVRELLADSGAQLGETDLLREVAIYAERSDISEELSRLEAHLQQFDAAIDSPEPAGRKLDFIAQEMLREANTIGSKAGDAQIARDIIEIKSAIDRIKEQVQNAE